METRSGKVIKPVQVRQITQFRKAPCVPAPVRFWITNNFVPDKKSDIKKTEVYNIYLVYCKYYNIISTARNVFSKYLKDIHPQVKNRRLGKRGQGVPCYGGIRFRTKTPISKTSDASPLPTQKPCSENYIKEQDYAATIISSFTKRFTEKSCFEDDIKEQDYAATIISSFTKRFTQKKSGKKWCEISDHSLPPKKRITKKLRLKYTF